MEARIIEWERRVSKLMQESKGEVQETGEIMKSELNLESV